MYINIYWEVKVDSKKLILNYLVLLLIIVLAGCSKVDSNNIASIEYVITNMFTCPDEILNEYLEKAIDEIPTKNEFGVYSVLSDTVHGKKLDEYLFDKYDKYTTDSAYKTFLSNWLISLQFASKNSGYKINVSNLDIKKVENFDTDYTFEVELKYVTDDGTEKTKKITGLARCKEEGRLSYLKINRTYYDLLNEMTEKINKEG